MNTNDKLREALAEVLEFQSSGKSPSIHDYGRWRRALAADDAARGAMREEFEAWWAKEGYKFLMATFFTKDAVWAGAQWQASRAAAPQSAEPVGDNDDELPGMWAYSDLTGGATDCVSSPTAPTDAEWLEEAMRYVEEYRATLHFSTREALRAHLSTRPQQANEADRLDAQGWRPISTAPKDGTRVLCVWACAWGEMVYEGWCQGVGTARDGGDFWRSHSLVPVSGRPTHWMPLPASPSKGAAMSAQAGGKEQGS